MTLRIEGTAQAWGQSLVAEGDVVPPPGGTIDRSISQVIVPEEEIVEQKSVSSSEEVGVVAAVPQSTVVQTAASVSPQSANTLSTTFDEAANIAPPVAPQSEDEAVAAIVQGAANAAVNGQAASAAVANEVMVSTSPTAESIAQELVGGVATSTVAAAQQAQVAVTVLGSQTNDATQIQLSAEESRKVDLSITLRSKKSEVVEFNHLQVPDPEVNFVYNFFVEDESNIEIQEDQLRDPLLKREPHNIPRYVELRWAPIEVKNQVPYAVSAAKENQELRQQVFGKNKGVTGYDTNNFAHAVQKQKKDMDAYVVDGENKKIVDIHKPEQVFDAISNPRTFANSLNVVLNQAPQPTSISSIPYTVSNVKA